MTARGTVYSVYRRRNSAVLQQLLAPALDAGWPIALWALDEPDPSLAALIAGSGPGMKFDLDEGCRLGNVDATPIRHLSPFASAYYRTRELAKLTQLLEERGTPGWKGVRRTFATWRPWRKQPPWLAQLASSSRS